MRSAQSTPLLTKSVNPATYPHPRAIARPEMPECVSKGDQPGSLVEFPTKEDEGNEVSGEEEAAEGFEDEIYRGGRIWNL